MKFIEPSVEYWSQRTGMDGIWYQIAKATKVSYQSQGRQRESDEDFVKRVILKPALIRGDINNIDTCSFDFNKMHGSCLEQCAVYLIIPDCKESKEFYSDLLNEQSSRVRHIYFNVCYYVTTNLRYILENYSLCLYAKYGTPYPTKYHLKRYTFSVITDIGVTREMNRHRAFSIIEESTRYCAYDKDKFNNELAFITPAWMKDSFKGKTELFYSLRAAEVSYLEMRRQNIPAEQCRQVLPLCTKTQAVYTAFASDWQHFLNLRSEGVSGKPHPNIKVIANKIKEITKEKKLW